MSISSLIVADKRPYPLLGTVLAGERSRGRHALEGLVDGKGKREKGQGAIGQDAAAGTGSIAFRMSETRTLTFDPATQTEGTRR